MLKFFVHMWFVVAIGFLMISCSTTKHSQANKAVQNNQATFWKEMNALCGNAFSGTLINAAANDTVFKDKSLTIHFRSCKNNEIRVPFVVGNDRSRTFVFTRSLNGIQLKHDHRHQDGTEDELTQYGGITSNSGSPTLQMFPADQHTANILPAAAVNIWWIELIPGKYFSYNLRRMGTDRLFTIQFNITKPVQPPAAPWGWKD